VSELHLPWLELSILIPVTGAIWVSRLRDAERARQHAVVFKGIVLCCALAAWIDFHTLHTFEAQGGWDLPARLFGENPLVIDELSAPLLPFAALLHLATAVATLRTKVKRFSFASLLLREAILLAMFSCRAPWGIIALLTLGTLPPLRELRSRRRPRRVYVSHMGCFVGLLIAGQAILAMGEASEVLSTVGVVLLAAAVLMRSGVFPLHLWVPDLFDRATFGTALTFVTPMVGAYAALRLVTPRAPDGLLQVMAVMSLFTAVYMAGLALVQREARRFFSYLFLSHSSLVLLGLVLATPIALTGGLLVWLSVGVGLSGFGLTLRSIEARTGRLSLTEYHGLYEHTPMLAAFFLLTGLACVGFPGTFGFIGTELLVEGAIDAYPFLGGAVVLGMALNSIAVVQTYFRVFTGTRHVASISLRSRLPERLAVLALTALILGAGLFPQPGVTSRFRAAEGFVRSRQDLRHRNQRAQTLPAPDPSPLGNEVASSPRLPSEARLPTPPVVQVARAGERTRTVVARPGDKSVEATAVGH
jgi:NADH-quinone oxidoreductase subunit M